MSIFSLSQSAADAVFGYANLVLILGAALVLEEGVKEGVKSLFDTRRGQVSV